jgi:uncharacterized protein YcbK (DUF882 family)
MSSAHQWSRRELLLAACAGGVASVAAWPRRATAAARTSDAVSPSASSWLELYNTHTGETLAIEFRNAGGYIATALAKLEHLLRDHRAEESHPIDPALYDQLSDVATSARRDARYEVISGYRSPDTNARMKAAGRGVATRSLHTSGQAIDIRLKGASCAAVRDIALGFARGGVGYYRSSDFVHLDTGRVRHW